MNNQKRIALTKPKNNSYHLIILLLLYSFRINASPPSFDSLQHVLKRLPQDSLLLRSEVYTHLSELYWDISLDSAEDYATHALALVRDFSDDQSNYKQARALNSLGVIELSRADYPQSMRYFNQAVQLYESLGSKQLLAPVKSNIGLIYDLRKEYDRAISFYREAMDLYYEVDSVKLLDRIIEIYGNIGTCYRASGQFELALQHVKEAIRLSESIKYELQIGNNKMEAGCILTNMGKFEEAKVYLDEALIILDTLGYNYFLGYCYDCLTMLSDSVGQADEVIRNGLLAQKYASIVEAQDILMTTSGLLAKNYFAKGKYVEAYKMKEEMMRYQDNLFNEEKENELHNLELERKDNQIALERQQKELQEAVNQQQTAWIISVTGALLSAIVVAILFFRGRQKEKDNNRVLETQKQEIILQNEELLQQSEEISAQRDFIEANNKLLNERNQQITQSMEAAQLIQNAILPLESEIHNYLNDYFVIYRPKDIVSGDFYWINQVDGKVIIAAVDCTGHGVPGAFMSMIGNTLLDEIVTFMKTTNPAAILTALNKQIIKLLNQKSSKDLNGMDIGIVVCENLSDNQVEVKFAGAKRPLYYTMTDGALRSIKGSNKSIGGRQNAKTFENHTVILEKGNMLYLSSDGFEDQHNAKKQRIGSRTLQALLEKSALLTTNEQQLHLETYLNHHMQDVKQRDDILVMGIKL